MRLFVTVLVIFVLIKVTSIYSFTQKGAKLLYKNPKYISNFTVFTSRKSRKSPYVTDLNCTLSTPWDKNVTILTEIQNTRAKSEKYDIKFKLCDGFKMKWVTDWVLKLSDARPVCPLPASTYHFVDIEFPPKNMPLPLATAHGSYHCVFTVYLTSDFSVKLLVLDGYIIG